MKQLCFLNTKRHDKFASVRNARPLLGYALLSHVPATLLASTTYFNPTSGLRYIRFIQYGETAIDYYYGYTMPNEDAGLYIRSTQLSNPSWTVPAPNQTTLIDQLCLEQGQPYQLGSFTRNVADLRGTSTPLDVLPSQLRVGIYQQGTSKYNTTIQEFDIPSDAQRVQVQPFIWCGDSFFAVLACGWRSGVTGAVGFAVISAPTCVPANPVYINNEVTFQVGFYKG